MFLFILFTSAIFHHRFLFVHFVTSPFLEFCHTLITLTFASRIIFRHHYPPFALSSVSTLVSITDSTLFFDALLFSSVFPLFFPLFFPPLPIRLWIFMHPRVVVPLTVLLFFLVISSYLSLSLFLWPPPRPLTPPPLFLTTRPPLALSLARIHATHILRRSHFFRHNPTICILRIYKCIVGVPGKDLSSLSYVKAFRV